MTGLLYVVATPIGNLEDISARAIKVLSQVNRIAAEDTRHSSRLLQHLGINTPLVAVHDHNEAGRVQSLIEQLVAGERIALISDAGTPLISDPGYRLIRAAIENHIQVKVIPGPSAVTTALLLSGLPSDRFCFEGFLPRTSGARISALEDLASEERTLIFFEAPHRLVETMEDFQKVFGPDREGAICREITKTYEEVIRGPIKDLIKWAKAKEILGEITLVMGGFASNKEFSVEDLISEVLKYEAAGISRKEAIAEVAKVTGVAKRQVFDAMVEHKSSEGKV